MRRRPRVFWALNHTTLAKSECALLERLGFEVLTPKICPKEILERSWRSCSIDYSYDHTLTIPAKDLAVLNACDFYAEKIDPEAIPLLNLHFDIIFVAAYYNMVESFRLGFDGLMILRAFGRENRLNYTDLLDGLRPMKNDSLSPMKKPRWQRWRDRLLLGVRKEPGMTQKLIARGRSFIFGCGYREIIENEPSELRQTAAFLPLGLPKETWSLADSWSGGDARVMFVCPNVHDPYYTEIYGGFIREYGDLPFAVYGNQSESTLDSRLVGFLPRAEYDARMRRHAVMFYHSSEPCHLHYHPLEAVAMGMPLVYMAGGMLERMGGRDQPGLCRSALEAKDKLRRIIAGDRKLIDSIRSAQPKLLDEFRDEFVESAWRQELLPRFKAAKPQDG